MDEIYRNAMLLDNKTGRVVGVDVHVENDDTFVFTPSSDPARPTVTADVESPEIEAFEEFSRIHGSGIAGGSTKQGALSDDQYVQRLLGFAKAHGPLFGFAGLIEGSAPAVIRESISDWMMAQWIMEKSLKADVFSKQRGIDQSSFDDCFWIEKIVHQNVMTFEFVFDAGAPASDMYRSCLKENHQNHFTTEDGSHLVDFWTAGLKGAYPGMLDRDANMQARFITCYPLADLGVRQPDTHQRFSFSCIDDRPVIAEEASSLTKIIAEAHTRGVSFGFRNPLGPCDNKKDGEYGIVCKCYLSYMWHELAQAYSRNSFRVCANPKCENIISINSDASRKRQFCCDRCRAQANNQKATEQQRKAREAFYAVKSWLEIYEAAFGKPYSHKDAEHEKLERRLDGWIREFEKTKAGKTAQKQGAGRKS